MTATIPHPTKPGQPRRYVPKATPKNYVECPVCGIPTGTFENAGCRSEMLPAASGYEDGARCRAHARSLELREDQTRRGLGIGLYRIAPTGRPAPNEWVAIDDMCQGTE